MDFASITIGELVQGGGFIAGLGLFVRYLVKRDTRNDALTEKREAHLTSRLSAVEDFQKGKLTEMVEATTQGLTETAAALREFTETTRAMPCRLTDPQVRDLLLKGGG